MNILSYVRWECGEKGNRGGPGPGGRAEALGAKLDPHSAQHEWEAHWAWGPLAQLPTHPPWLPLQPMCC